MQTEPTSQAANDSARLPVAAASADAKAGAAAASHRIPKADLVELLREAGYRWTIRDDLGELCADVRENPTLATACGFVGLVVGMLAVLLPAIVVGLFQ